MSLAKGSVKILVQYSPWVIIDSLVLLYFGTHSVCKYLKELLKSFVLLIDFESKHR